MTPQIGEHWLYEDYHKIVKRVDILDVIDGRYLVDHGFVMSMIERKSLLKEVIRKPKPKKPGFWRSLWLFITTDW
jgi:hypothetical protein